jgi:myosin light chain 6
MSALSEDQIYEIQEIFSLFETRGNGKVEATKIGDILRALGLNPTEAEVHKLVGEVKDGGQGIALQGFLPLYQAVAKRNHEKTSTAEDFIEGFRVFDKDSNGTISSAELRHLLTTLGEKMEEVDVENLIAPFEDQHGNINYEDFVKHILQSANQ